MVKIVIAKREEYIQAWNQMYKENKALFNLPMFDGINPSLNKKPLKTEIDNVAAIAYAPAKNDVGNIKGDAFDSDKLVPVGIFSFVITNSKIIGKQFVVNPDYQGQGIGKALVLSLEKELIEKGYETYYIGCSKMSAGIMKSFGAVPYSEDFEHDMFKFNIDLKRANFKDQYDKFVLSKNIEIEKL